MDALGFWEPVIGLLLIVGICLAFAFALKLLVIYPIEWVLYLFSARGYERGINRPSLWS